MSLPLKNWAFFMFTIRPVLAADTSKSVCLHKKAGICITSATSATGAACQLSCMSVSILRLYFFFMLSNIINPFSIPGPRNELMDVRLALSNEALKIISMPNSRLILSISFAIISSSSADSITHGPAMYVLFMLIYIIIYAKLRILIQLANLYC